MVYLIKYKQLYPTYLNNAEYVFGSNGDLITVYKRLENTITSEENDLKERKKYKQYIASHLEIVISFNKFKPEKKSICFVDNKIKYDVHFYLDILPAFYCGIDSNCHYVGKYVEWYQNGLIKTTGFIRHGMRELKWTNYSDTGSVQSVGNILNGVRSGFWTIYSSNYVTECEYKGGVLFGNVTVWKNKEKTIKLKQFSMLNGKKHGEYIEYLDYSDPNLSKKKSDILIPSHYTGVKVKGNYINDKKSGLWFEVDNNYEYYTKSYYLNGIKKRFETKYHSDGTLCKKIFI